MYKECPACSCTESTPINIGKVVQCACCHGLYGECSEEESKLIYKREWYKGNSENLQYIDLWIGGQWRFHGWIDVDTKKIVQTG